MNEEPKVPAQSNLTRKSESEIEERIAELLAELLYEHLKNKKGGKDETLRSIHPGLNGETSKG